MVEEQAHEEEVRIPLYYERFLEERDKRFSSEIARLETTIRHNGQRIDELRADNARQHEELREAIARLDAKVKSLCTHQGAPGNRSRPASKTSITRPRNRTDSYFRWTVGLLLLINLGIAVLLIQNLLIR